MMKNKGTLILTSLVCLIPVIAGIILYPSLPDEIVTHWGFDGEPNGWSSKFMGAIGLPLIMLILNICLPFIARLDPKHKNINPKLMKITLWIIPVVSIMCSVLTLSYAKGMEIGFGFMLALLGLLFIVIGNYLPKTKQSYTMGIKLPWTLKSEENWNRTHRLGGFLWVVCGVICIICGIFRMNIALCAAIIGVAVIVPVIYSFVLHKKGI